MRVITWYENKVISFGQFNTFKKIIKAGTPTIRLTIAVNLWAIKCFVPMDLLLKSIILNQVRRNINMVNKRDKTSVIYDKKSTLFKLKPRPKSQIKCLIPPNR